MRRWARTNTRRPAASPEPVAANPGPIRHPAQRAAAPARPSAVTGQRTGPRKASARPPEGRAYGRSRATAAIRVRDTHHSPAMSRIPVGWRSAPPTGARNAAAAATTLRTRPTPGRAMTANRRARSSGASSPSALGPPASPSRCSMPVGPGRPDTTYRRHPGSARPGPPPTTTRPGQAGPRRPGEPAERAGAGHTCPPNGVRKDKADRIQTYAGPRGRMRPATTQHHLVGHLGQRAVEPAEGVGEPAARQRWPGGHRVPPPPRRRWRRRTGRPARDIPGDRPPPKSSAASRATSRGSRSAEGAGHTRRPECRPGPGPGLDRSPRSPAYAGAGAGHPVIEVRRRRGS